jgi:hypothetical protein
MRKLVSVFIILAILINTAGCSEEWRRKFIRKKKAVAKKPRIWQEKKYPNAPTEAMYVKHYNYTISWLSELAGDLGQNNKKDLRCIEEALSQAKDMQNCLVREKAKELDKHISRLTEIRDIIKRQDLGQANKDYVRSSIEREERFLRREFYYHKIQNFMKKSFNEEELPADADETK